MNCLMLEVSHLMWLRSMSLTGKEEGTSLKAARGRAECFFPSCPSHLGLLSLDWASPWPRKRMFPGTCDKCLDQGAIWPQVICESNLIPQIANCIEILGSLADAGTGTSVRRSSPSDACSHQAICRLTGAARGPLGGPRASTHTTNVF